MTVKKGLSSLVNATPDFSNQALENAINEIKAIDKDDGYLFIKSQFDMDTAIRDNTVLTQTQKNDALETLYNAQPHLHIGRYLTDIIRHTRTILDGTIVHLANPDTEDPADFLEILQSVQSIQNLIPTLYGVTPAEKSRSVNDHLGSLNNKFVLSDDSTPPLFTRLTRVLTLIDTTARVNSTLATGTAAVRYSNTQLVLFLDTIRDDSTDFVTTLNNRVNQSAGNMASLNTRISDALAGDPISELQAIREEINVQVALENSNLSGVRTYVESLTNNISYTALADDKDLKDLLLNITQNPSWKAYFENYDANKASLNPQYDDINTDSDKESIINQVLRNRGLPDVQSYLDIDGVVAKASGDSRIDTKGFDHLTNEQIIDNACKQLGIGATDTSIWSQSKTLLNNLNDRDRKIVADELDLNEDSKTLS